MERMENLKNRGTSNNNKQHEGDFWFRPPRRTFCPVSWQGQSSVSAPEDRNLANPSASSLFGLSVVLRFCFGGTKLPKPCPVAPVLRRQFYCGPTCTISNRYKRGRGQSTMIFVLRSAASTTKEPVSRCTFEGLVGQLLLRIPPLLRVCDRPTFIYRRVRISRSSSFSSLVRVEVSEGHLREHPVRTGQWFLLHKFGSDSSHQRAA